MRTTRHTRQIARAVACSLAALGAAAALAAPAGAQGRWGRGGNGGYDQGGGYGNANGTYDGARTLYQWTGRVDHEAYIVMQSGDVRTRLDSYDNNSGARVRVGAELPQADGIVDVRVAEGRGRVDVVEQPSRRNGYRTVVHVRDDDAGAGLYRLVATWRPAGGYADNGRGGYGRDDDDGRYGNGRDRDGRDRDGRDGRHRDDGDGRYGNGTYGNGTSGSGVYGGGNYGGSGTLHWRGRVDDVEEIRLQGGRVDVRTVSGQGASGVRSQLAGAALPARDVAVRVDDRSGRGRVLVVQQPRAWNGYTAVVRVEDHDPGAGYHDFDVSW